MVVHDVWFLACVLCWVRLLAVAVPLVVVAKQGLHGQFLVYIIFVSAALLAGAQFYQGLAKRKLDMPGESA